MAEEAAGAGGSGAGRVFSVHEARSVHQVVVDCVCVVYRCVSGGGAGLQGAGC